MSLIKNKAYKAAMHNSVELGRALQRVLWSDSLGQSEAGLEFMIFFFLFLRAERSLASIRALVRLGLPDDAVALVRVMIEKIITAEYILLSEPAVAEEFMDFSAVSAWKSYQDLLRSSPVLLRPLTKEQLRVLEERHNKAVNKVMPDGSVRKRYGRGHDWTEISLSKRADRVDELLKTRFSPGITRLMFDSNYRKSAGYIHGSFSSLLRSVTEMRKNDATLPGSDLIEVDIAIRVRGNDSKLGVEALDMANAAAVQMLVFLIEKFKQENLKGWVRKFRQRNATRPRAKAER